MQFEQTSTKLKGQAAGLLKCHFDEDAAPTNEGEAEPLEDVPGALDEDLPVVVQHLVALVRRLLLLLVPLFLSLTISDERCKTVRKSAGILHLVS